MEIMSYGERFIIPGFSLGLNGVDSPVGTIISFMGLNPPKGYLICDGTEYNIADYPFLASHIKTEFSTVNYFGGDGTNTFAVPDFRNLFLRGYHGDSAEQLSGEIGVRQEATVFPWTVGQYANSGRYNVITNFTGVLDTSVTNALGPKNTDAMQKSNTFAQGVTPNASPPTQYTDYKDAYPQNYTSRPVNVAVLYCIKAVPSAFSDVNGDVYSTEKTRIGTWIDGKPLYRKVLQTTTNSSSGWGSINTGEKFDYAYVYGVIYRNDSSNKTGIIVPSGDVNGRRFQVQLNSPQISYENNMSYLYSSKAIFILIFTEMEVDQ